MPQFERNRSINEPGAGLIAATPPLQERSLAKTAALVSALTDALRARGVEPRTAALCAQIGMDTLRIATGRWRDEPALGLGGHLDQAFAQLRDAAGTLA